MAIRIIPYKQGSRSARALADEVGGRVLKLQDSRWQPREGDKIINWGNTGWRPRQDWWTGLVLNKPQHIRTASNKREFFEAVSAAGNADIIPRFWTDRNEIPNDAFPIVCRTVLAGHSGAGIVIADTVADLVPAPLYVQYVKKTLEFRVHVGKKEDDYEIIAVQRKARNRSVPDDQINWKVRNHANGFIYAREGFITPQAVEEVAKRALQCTELDFGAVDVILNERQNRPYVLEVNTAPGLEGQTVADYARFFA